MLDQLRKHARSWMTKTILGAMAIGLIFYFGYSGLRKATQGGFGGGKGVAAVVNGESIPLGKFDQSYESQMKFYEQLTKGQPPAALAESVKQNVLDRLIKNKLFAQQAQAIGLTVSDKELVQEITANPSFMKDGMFNKKAYLESFKPNYEKNIGEDYEATLKEELLAEKFENLLRSSVQVTDAETRQEYLLSNTQLNLQKAILDPAQFQTDSEVKLKQAESEILSAFGEKAPPKGPSPLEAVKKKYNLKVEDTGFHSLRDKAAFVGDPSATEAYECIFKLSPEHPVCMKALPVGKEILFFKLLERREPNWAKYDDEKESVRQALVTRRQALIVKQIGDALAKQAGIKIQIPNPNPSS